MSLIYEKGQVVIPKYIRELFNIMPGSQVHFRVENNRIYIDPAEEAMAELDRLARGATNTFEETEEEIRRLKRKRVERLLNVPGL